MFGFGKKKKEKVHSSITVEFVERQAAVPFAVVDVPIEQLPDTFEIETVMHLGNEDWRVADALPARKEEFRRSGHLRLFLYKPQIATVPTKDILFSLPSISEELPALQDADALENVFVVHEDDWRQCELVSAAHLDLIRSELEAIERIYNEQSAGHGFRAIHVRKAIRAPLEGTKISLDELTRRLGPGHVYSGVAFNSTAATVTGGFAFRPAEGWTFWGRGSEDGMLAAVCVMRPDTENENRHIVAALNAFLKEHNLLLVDWNRLAAVQNVTTPDAS